MFQIVTENPPDVLEGRDNIINAMLHAAKIQINKLHRNGKISSIISAGGGTGTHICTTIMRELSLGVPKVMVSTVASRNMADIVSTKDITMIHSVADLLGVNSISGNILAKAAAAICAMVQSRWQPAQKKSASPCPFSVLSLPGLKPPAGPWKHWGMRLLPFTPTAPVVWPWKSWLQKGIFAAF